MASTLCSSGLQATYPDDIRALHQILSFQANTVLSELDAFTQYIASQPAESRPDIHLSKFHSDVQRETNLLRQHGHTLGFDQPELQNLLSSEDGCLVSIAHKDEIRRDLPSNGDMSLDVATENSTHRIRSSNVAHLATLWDVLKQCTGVVAVRKQIRYVSHSKQQFTPLSKSSKTNRNTRDRAEIARMNDQHAPLQASHYNSHNTSKRGRLVRRQDKEPVTVDIITQHGGIWVKLFTKSLAWTLMDLAKEGCVDLASSPSSSSDDERDGIGDEDGFAEVKLVKMAREVLAASRTARFGLEHRHPDVHVYLTKISRRMSRDVDVVLEHLESIGIKVICADETAHGSFEESTSIPLNNIGTSEPRALEQPSKGSSKSHSLDLSKAFARMTLPLTPTQSTEVLNIDCTLLIALISDISHLHHDKVVIPSHYNGRPAGKDIETQLESEPHQPLLPDCIFPILIGKRLVCTAKAAAHLRNIVRIMGSETETKRSWIFLPVGPEDRRSRDELKNLLAKVSRHDVPDGLQLPIEVVETESESEEFNTEGDKALVNIEREVMRLIADHPRLSPLNRSVFYYGWRESITTVSLNRVVSEWLDRAIDGTLNEIEAERGCHGDIAVESGFCGPKVLICGRERSLLGNEK